MSDRAWEDLIDRIDLRFGIAHKKKFDQPLEDDSRLTSNIDRVDFIRKDQEYRIERVTSPVITDKKTKYNKVGIATSTHVVYDPTELAHKVIFYKIVAGEPQEISPEELLH